MGNYTYDICRDEYTILTPEGKLEVWNSLELLEKMFDRIKQFGYTDQGIFWAEIELKKFMGVEL